ncbi:hypothetical protein FF100_05480 [Methylobacterium terricola]|uniref:Uncharacterized protein n=1 Tax=Methylobacterium terricola TaxID=2583531 RepID=A0A5C4LMD9_9HYPH|nr:hypothetical protein [Methylobacterium terricola]TNC15018.1 hypothetical protein FF100_05480 [Methylobacterium terricola]
MKVFVKYFALSLVALGVTQANAQDRSSAVTVFPPIMREMARDTGGMRPWAELTTTPQPVPAARRSAPQPELVARGYVEPVAAAVTGALD